MTSEDARKHDEEWNTRNVMLEHYSSQTAAHATHLLTLALIALAVVQVRTQLPSWHLQCPLPSLSSTALALALLVVAVVRTIGRTMYWGYLSHAILMVPDSLGQMKKEELTGELKEMVDKGYCAFPFTKAFVLHLAADKWVATFRKKGPIKMNPTWFRSLADLRGWFFSAFFGIIALVILTALGL